MIFEGFSKNGLQILIQSGKLCISALDEILRLKKEIYNFEVCNVKNFGWGIKLLAGA